MDETDFEETAQNVITSFDEGIHEYLLYLVNELNLEYPPKNELCKETLPRACVESVMK